MIQAAEISQRHLSSDMSELIARIENPRDSIEISELEAHIALLVSKWTEHLGAEGNQEKTAHIAAFIRSSIAQAIRAEYVNLYTFEGRPNTDQITHLASLAKHFNIDTSGILKRAPAGKKKV